MEDNQVGQLGRAIRQATRSGVETRRRVFIARAKSLLKGHRLPPGNFFRLDPLLASDPKALALKAAKTGPILTGIWGDKIAIFVTSLSVARRLLQKHRDDLNATSIDITSVVPKGIIRTMEGVDHKTYRKHFSLAIAPTAFSPREARSIVEEGLAKANADGRPDNAICEEIALRMLLLTFVGIARQSAIHQELEDQFNAMAPNGFAWRVGPRQKAAFEILRSRLVALASGKEDALNPDSVLYRLAENDATDLTAIGNLIYMIEMGRFDISTFLFRIANFLGDDWSLLKRIVAGEKFRPRHFNCTGDTVGSSPAGAERTAYAVGQTRLRLRWLSLSEGRSRAHLPLGSAQGYRFFREPLQLRRRAPFQHIFQRGSVLPVRHGSSPVSRG